MKHLIWLSAWALMFTLALFSCGTDGEDTDPPLKDEPPPPVVPNQNPVLPPSHAACPNGTSWSYENLGEAFLLNYCTACHNAALAPEQRFGAPETVNLDTPEDVQLWRSKVIERLEAGTMPPSGFVPADEKATMLEWLKCGAPAGEDRIR